MAKLGHPEELLALQERAQREAALSQTVIAVCGGTGCRAFGAEELGLALQAELRKRGLDKDLEVKLTGCPGLCERGPLVVVKPEGLFYCGLKPSDAPELVSALARGEPAEPFLYRDPVSGQTVLHEEEIPFYRKQVRRVLAGNGKIDPRSIYDYIRIGGYQALAKALTMKPEEIIDQIDQAGLRGRGGAGFPTARKWRACREAQGSPKYVIGNGDEGDPGAFMDRALMEGNPHQVLEGMIIGAYAIGAQEGVLYVRAEYPLAYQNLEKAVRDAESLGLLGEDILGSGFSFRIRVFLGAGAFVCGEETALLASIMGRRGQPRPRPPFPAQKGLWGKPTVINNVETWANVPLIVKNGPAWFRSLGTEKSPGTKIFSLTGNVRNTGLVEIPMGMTLRELVYEIGGGAREGTRCKAVQIGGPSGGCIPEELFNTPVDFDSLQSIGAMMGSGGLVVLYENSCMVNVAKFFVEFTQDESCGQCPPCRIGTKRMLEILSRITEGRGKPEDLELLEEVALGIKATSLCGLGQTAPNPVLTTLRYYRAEYEEHLRGRCPTDVCRALVTYSIEEALCIGCGLCAKNCPQGAIFGVPKKPHRIEPRLCSRCGACLTLCPKGAIKRT